MAAVWMYLNLLGTLVFLWNVGCSYQIGPPERQLGCPIPFFGNPCKVVRPIRHCKSTLDCVQLPGKRFKCCTTSCGGTKCEEQIFSPGACPAPPRKVCVKELPIKCGVDSECSGNKLCCSIECGGTDCREPAGFPEVRFGCALPPRGIFACPAVLPRFQCKTDQDCKAPKLCCKTACGSMLCQDPNPKPGRCPIVPLRPCPRHDVLECGIDRECNGNAKCCKTTCGGSKCIGNCFKNGDVFQNNQPVPSTDPCETCVCKEGNVECVPILCAPIPTCEGDETPYLKPATCCTWICPKLCVVDGVTYKVGDEIPKKDPCLSCRCTEQGELCASLACRPPPNDQCKMKPGTCCDFVCPDKLPERRKGCAIPKFGPFCKRAKVGRFCKNDEDCEGSKICCVTDCGGSACLEPKKKKKKKCKDNKKWRNDVTHGDKSCKKCTCKKLRKMKELLEYACKNNIHNVMKECCKSCKNVK